MFMEWHGVSIMDISTGTTYLPAIVKGWKSMVSSVWPDGKVGFIQPIGADPKSVTREMTEVYGVGGFLMAGTEITRLIKTP